MQKELVNYGQYDIHIGWASYRGFLDKNQVVLSNVVWRNPPQYDKSPYMLRIKELSVSFSIMALYRTIKYGKVLSFDQVIIDSVEVYFEKPTSPEVRSSLNFWSAIGVETKDEAHHKLSSFFHFVVGKIKSKMAMSLSFTSAHREKDEEDDGGEDEDVGEDETDDGGDASYGSRKSSVTSVEDGPAVGHRHRKSSDGGGLSQGYLTASRKLSSGAPPAQRQRVVKEPLKVELNSLVVLNLVAHPLDLLSGVHMNAFKHTDIRLKCFHMTRKELTGWRSLEGSAH